MEQQLYAVQCNVVPDAKYQRPLERPVSRIIDRCTAEELSGALYAAGVDMDALFSKPVTVLELRMIYRKLLDRQLREWGATHEIKVPPRQGSIMARLVRPIKSLYLRS
jgi:hypothetical protein